MAFTNQYLEAASAGEPQAEGQNVIGGIQVHTGSMVGFGDVKVERVQDQLPASRQLSLNQGSVPIGIEELTKASKPTQRKRAPKKEKPLVQSVEVSEGANKDLGTKCSQCRSLLFSI